MSKILLCLLSVLALLFGYAAFTGDTALLSSLSVPQYQLAPWNIWMETCIFSILAAGLVPSVFPSLPMPILCFYSRDALALAATALAFLGQIASTLYGISNVLINLQSGLIFLAVCLLCSVYYAWRTIKEERETRKNLKSS